VTATPGLRTRAVRPVAGWRERHRWLDVALRGYARHQRTWALGWLLSIGLLLGVSVVAAGAVLAWLALRARRRRLRRTARAARGPQGPAR
jgi:uncharacterized RDD family membrane protein YckC